MSPDTAKRYLSIQELAVHGWDIRSRLEPSTQLAPAGLPVLLERIPDRPIPWSTRFPLEPGSPTSLRFRFELTGEGAGHKDIVVEDDNAHIESAGPETANVTVRCDSGTFVLLMFGRLTLDSASRNGLLSLEGDPRHTAAFDMWLTSGSR